jgi:hypothetical protein
MFAGMSGAFSVRHRLRVLWPAIWSSRTTYTQKLCQIGASARTRSKALIDGVGAGWRLVEDGSAHVPRHADLRRALALPLPNAE